MTSLAWRLVHAAAHLLDAVDRETLLGDAAESGASPTRALCDVLGLAARRHVTAWGDWRPWLLLVTIVLPLGVLLSIVSRFWIDEAVWTIHLYAQHWRDWDYFLIPGWRDYVLGLTATLVLQWTALACWSWSCGLVLRGLSRETAPVNGVLLTALFFGATLGTTTTGRLNTFNADIYESVFYRTVLPLALRMFLAVLPAVIGLRRTPRQWSPHRLVMWAAVIAALTVMSTRAIQGALFFGWLKVSPAGAFFAKPILSGQWLPGPDGVMGTPDDVRGWLLYALSSLVLLPTTLMLASATWQRWSERVTQQ
jgi:hypothetical protein